MKPRAATNILFTFSIKLYSFRNNFWKDQCYKTFLYDKLECLSQTYTIALVWHIQVWSDLNIKVEPPL
jgi:hypothetical protein